MSLLKPTYDELFALVRHQSKMIFEQGQTIKRLEKKITELEEKLRLNSKNSSKPPSTGQKGKNDVPKKKGGAKPGHPGHFRPLFPTDQVDAFINLRAEDCPSCGETVQPSGEPPSIHQQVEIASKPYIVTQYNRITRRISYGSKSKRGDRDWCHDWLFRTSCYGHFRMRYRQLVIPQAV